MNNKKELHLFLMDEVSSASIYGLVQSIVKANNDNAIFEEEYFDGTEAEKHVVEKIVLHLNTCGGYVYAGMQLINAIMSSKIPVECIVTNAHSMGFMIMVACDKRKMYKRGKCMYHNMSVGFEGDHETIMELTRQMELEKDILHEILKQRTKLTKKDIDKIYRNKKDRYFYSNEALEMGIIDEIIEDIQK